jgi:hypothetical protein
MGTINFLFHMSHGDVRNLIGVVSVKDAPHARRKKMVEKVKDLTASDARFTTHYVAKCDGIYVVTAHTIPRRDLIMKRINVIWIPHLNTK